MGCSLLGLGDAAGALLQPKGRSAIFQPLVHLSSKTLVAHVLHDWCAVLCHAVQCDFIADVLGLSKVGWVFTQAAKDTPDDYIMSSSEVRYTQVQPQQLLCHLTVVT